MLNLDVNLGDEIPMSPDDFKAAFRRHPGGVAVITAVGEDGPVALTATSVSSVCAEPPLLVFSVTSLSSSAPTITTADTVVVHFIDAANVHIAQLGATHGIDRFADTTLWTRLDSGDVAFHVVPVWIRARVLERIVAGGSTIILAEALQSSVVDTREPLAEREELVYIDRAWHRIGAHSRMETS